MSGKRGANVGVLIALFNLWLNLGCLAENNIGCLFNQSVCEEEGEQCYNDNAFGRCLRKFEEPNSEDLYRHDLDIKALQSLEREMQRLFALGYRWSHIYTQCVLQAMLESFRYQTEYGDSVCDTLIDQDLEMALKVIEEDGQEVDPDSVAYVKFTPSVGNPHAEFADEVYFPPLVDDEIDPNLVVGLRDKLVPWSSGHRRSGGWGVTLDAKCSWDPHLRSAEGRARGVMLKLAPLLRPVSPLEYGLKIRLFLLCVMSILLYSAPVFSYLPRYRYNHLRTVYHRFLRLILEAPPRVPNRVLLTTSGLPSLDSRIRGLAERFFTRAQASSNMIVRGIGDYDAPGRPYLRIRDGVVNPFVDVGR